MPEPGAEAILTAERAPIALLGFRPGPGGLPRTLLDLIDGLQQRARAVDLLRPPGDYPDLARLSTPPPPEFALAADDPRLARAQLTRYLEERRPTAILSNKERTSLLLADLREQGVALPALWLRFGSDVREKIRRQRFWRRARYRASLLRQIAAADGLIANSAGVAESLATLLEAVAANRRVPIRILPDPLNLARIRDLATAPAPHPWLAERDTPVILGMGRLVRVKDFPCLIRAFARLRETVPARLIIFGEGRHRASLERLIRRLRLDTQVALPGFTDNPFAALARASLFALSSRFEGAPNVLIEALACATPCVSTDCRSGPRDILAGGTLGPLTPVGDPLALAEAMRATLDNPPPAATLRDAAQPYDIDRAVAAYIDTLCPSVTPGPRP